MMDMTLNRIPENVRNIHLIAICGTAMGALACMLQDLGFEVTGSDQKVYPPMSLFLEDRGIRISDGFREENISYGPDLVIVGNAVVRDNPEARQVRQMGLPYCSMPQALNHFVGFDKRTLLISGTHGKTTTSSILAWILHSAGADPSFMIGGILKNFNSNYRLGSGPYFVVEGDEYDTAFFDKGPKFLHFNPLVTILTGIEFDHADIFDDLHHVKTAFGQFLSGLSRDSILVAHDDDKNVDELLNLATCRIERYGLNGTSPWRLNGISIDQPWTTFEVIKHNESFGIFKTALLGEHNLLNVLASIAMADHLKIAPDIISKALETFEGIKRRQEIRGQKNQITVMDDFAHHPTAVRETIRAVKTAHSENRLIAVFEPRTNTSMRDIFQNEYTRSFESADLICIRKPPLLKKIPLGQRFSSEQLVTDLKNRGKNAYYFEHTEDIIEFLVKQATPGDLILVMSNGGFDNIHERLLESL
jgi:UDP-N-acetylmuramate: L-alanyl-gamma-D-glutamyl-meso-diaminopimelate ligase